MLDGKVILVTGGTGSFGMTLVGHLLENSNPKAIRIFSRDEQKQYELAERFPDERLRFLLGDVRDRDRLELAAKGVDVIVHAAALKMVPGCEYNPTEAKATNVDGAENVVWAAIANDVPKTIALSSDKAVNPVNLYGASKLMAERIFVAANALSETARFSLVRYGNVIASRGSVIPMFREQARARICQRCQGEGEVRFNPGYPDPQTEDSAPCPDCHGEGAIPGEVTITDEAMTRFLMPLDRTVDFVLFSLERMAGGEIFVPKMPSARMIDVADAIAPDVPRRVIGIRPGEKLHETLVTADESRHATDLGSYFVIAPSFCYWGAEFERGEELVPGFAYASDTNDEWLTVGDLSEATLVGSRTG